MFEQLERKLEIDILKNSISEKEKQLALLKEKLEYKKVLLERNSIFYINEIFPIIEKLINNIFSKNYKYRILRKRSDNGTNYMYVLTDLNDSIDCDSDSFYEALYTNNIIILATGYYKNEPNKISLIKKKNKNTIHLNIGMPKEILFYVISFLESVIDNRIFGLEEKTYKQLLEEYISNPNIKKLYRGIK